MAVLDAELHTTGRFRTTSSIKPAPLQPRGYPAGPPFGWRRRTSILDQTLSRRPSCPRWRLGGEGEVCRAMEREEAARKRAHQYAAVKQKLGALPRSLIRRPRSSGVWPSLSTMGQQLYYNLRSEESTLMGDEIPMDQPSPGSLTLRPLEVCTHANKLAIRAT